MVAHVSFKKQLIIDHSSHEEKKIGYVEGVLVELLALRSKTAVDESENLIVEQRTNWDQVFEKFDGVSFESLYVTEVNCSLNIWVAAKKLLKEGIHKSLVSLHHIFENDALQFEVMYIIPHVANNVDRSQEELTLSMEGEVCFQHC